MDFSKRQADPRRHIVGLGVVILFHALDRLCAGDGSREEGRRGGPRTDRDQGHRGGEEAAAAARGRGAAAAEARSAAAAVHSAAGGADRRRRRRRSRRSPPRRRRRRRRPSHRSGAAAAVAAPPAPPPAAPPAPPPPVTAGVACSNYTTVMGDAGFPREAHPPGHREGRSADPVHADRVRRDQGHQGACAPRTRSSRATASASSASTSARGRAATSLVTVPFGYKLE